MSPAQYLAAVAACAVAQGAAASTAAERFAPGSVSSAAIEDAIALAPQGDLVVFSRRPGEWGGPPQPGTLLQSRRRDGGWSKPEALPFSGSHDDSDPAFSPDGSRLFFVSSRPAPDGRRDPDLWVVDRDDSGWGEPRHLGNVVNSPAAEYSPSVTSRGRLYFASSRDGGHGQGDLWYADPHGDGFGTPENLGQPVNSANGEWNVSVAPDESWIVFEASGRPAGHSPSGDLYVSYREGGSWAAPLPLDAVNTAESELNARVTPDGETFLFIRSTPADAGRQADVLSLPAANVLPHLADPRLPRAAVVSRSAHVAVILEAGTWRTLARLPTGRGPHEIAVAAGGHTAYTADYGMYPEPHEQPVGPAPPRWIEEESATVSVLDLERLRSLRSIRVDACRRNHGILAARDGRRLWTTCEAEGAVVELDAASGQTLRRFATATGSHQLLASPGDAMLVTSNVESGSVSLIALDDGEVTTVSTGRGAEGIAMSPDGRWLWVGNGLDGTVSVVDMASRSVVATLDSGGKFPVKLAFSIDGQAVWVVNTGSRSIVVFDASRRVPLRTLSFESPPLGILALPAGDMLVSFPRLNEIAVLSGMDGTRRASVRGIVEADGLAWIAPSER